MPAEVRNEAQALRAAVAGVVPTPSASNLIIGSWNLRALSGLTRAWNAPADATPKRDLRAMALIAAVISAFDVVAV